MNTVLPHWPKLSCTLICPTCQIRGISGIKYYLSWLRMAETGPEDCQSCLKITSSNICAIPQGVLSCHFMIFWLIVNLMVNYWVFKALFAIKHVFVPVLANYTKAYCSQKDQFLCYVYYKYMWINVRLRYSEALSTEELLASQGRKTFYLETLYINYDFLLHSLFLETFAWKQDSG